MTRSLNAVVLLAALALPARAAELPPGVARLLPPGYDVLRAVRAGPAQAFYVVALAAHDEAEQRRTQAAPTRPLLLVQQQADGAFALRGRNDTVVLRADEGGQCDPFLDGGGVIAVKGRLFTVQNGVACGPQHWTDYITFRFDDAANGYMFDNERSQSWSLNPSRDPNAEALRPDGPPRVERAARGRPVRFADWRPRR